MHKLTLWIWADDKAGQMVKFYKSVFKGTKVGKTWYWGPNPMGVKEGSVLTKDITIMGQKIKLLNGLVKMPFNESMSLAVPCKNQREIDMYWKKLISGGGKPVQCGWLIDQFGVRWQIYPAEIEKWQSSKNKKKTQALNEAIWSMVKLDTKKLKEAFDRA
jgi:predicted 3-demethylubiquinone-9 3-methyltransferase (glyoxalase superfamily)